MASYDTVDLGKSVSAPYTQGPPQIQENAFSGVNGVTSLWHGLRGGMFEVEGVLYGSNRSDVDSWYANLQTYADGIARVLTDTGGNQYPNVLFLEIEWTGPYGYDTGCARPYRARFRKLG